MKIIFILTYLLLNDLSLTILQEHLKATENGNKTSQDQINQLEVDLLKNRNYSDYAPLGKIIFFHYKQSGDFEKGNEHINQILERKKDILADSTRIDLEISKLWMYLFSDQYDKLITVSDSLLDLNPNINQSGWIYYFKGQGENETGDYKSAFDSYMSSLKLFTKSNFREGLSYAYTGLGDIQRNLKKFDESITYYNKAVDNARLSNNKMAEINSLVLLGTTLTYKGEIEEGIKFYNEALEISKQTKDNFNTARCLNNIGHANIRLGNLSEALKNNSASLEINLASNMDYSVLVNYLNISDIYWLQKKYDLAKQTLDKATTFLEDRNFKAEKIEILKQYSKVYEGLNDYKTAMTYYKEYVKAKNILVSEHTQKVIGELQIKYETEEKDRKLEKAKYELGLKNLHNRNLIWGFIVLTIATGATIAFLVYRNTNLRKLYLQNIKNLQTRQFVKKTNNEDDPLYKIFTKILSTLDEDQLYKKPTLSITELSEIIGSNEKYVSSSIAKYTETNFSNFINHYRINEAKRLLFESSDISIGEVMESSGFNSRTPFYNAFTKLTGMSPNQFKKMNNTNLEAN